MVVDVPPPVRNVIALISIEPNQTAAMPVAAEVVAAVEDTVRGVADDGKDDRE